MVKSDIVSALCEKGYYKNAASTVVDEVFQIIHDALVREEQVQIRGFGIFEVKIRKGRNSKNISTGEMRVSNDCKIPVFRASDSLKKDIRTEAVSQQGYKN
jgi:integration host factor subunit beta